MQTRPTKVTLASTTANAFAGLAERLNDWRRTRSRGQRIPKELWSAATVLARDHGLASTATALKLNYYDLQRRLEPGRRKAKPALSRPAFVELPGLVAAKPDPGTVDLVHTNGSRLTLRLSNPRSRDLLPLVAAFLRS